MINRAMFAILCIMGVAGIMAMVSIQTGPVKYDGMLLPFNQIEGQNE